MKKLILIFAISNLTQIVNASTTDIRGRGTQFIKVTESADRQSVSFEMCWIKQPLNCSQIGNQKFYSKKDLIQLRNSEKKDVILSGLADVGILAVTFYTGGIAGATWMASSGGPSMVGAAMGVTAGTGSSMVAFHMVDALNPMEQYRQVQVLSNDVINDKDIQSDRKITDIARTLATVLSNLEK